MLDRIFLLLLGICSAIMSGLSWYSWRWLQSIGAPSAAIEGYRFQAGISLVFLLISAGVLLVISSFLLARFRRSWTLWASFVYFAVFIIVRYFFLERSAASFQAANGLAEASLVFAPLWGAAIVVAAACFVFLNQMLILQLTERLYPTDKIEVPDLSEDQPNDEGTEVDKAI